MILDEILENLKSKGKNKAYTINNQSYSYEELYKFVCNIYHFILLNNKETIYNTIVFFVIQCNSRIVE